jgi:hypothetical protein
MVGIVNTNLLWLFLYHLCSAHQCLFDACKQSDRPPPLGSDLPHHLQSQDIIFIIWFNSAYEVSTECQCYETRVRLKRFTGKRRLVLGSKMGEASRKLLRGF